MENMKHFTLQKNKEFLGKGAFGIVYKISPRRVIKIFDSEDHFEDGLVWAKDEIEGVNCFYNGLPVIDIVKTKYNRFFRAAIIKKYLPYKITEEELEVIPKTKADRFDCCLDQYRKDYKGIIYRVDTQYKLLKRICREESKENAL